MVYMLMIYKTRNSDNGLHGNDLQNHFFRKSSILKIQTSEEKMHHQLF